MMAEMDAGRLVPSGTCLYFPYIHIRDENWLKCALLFWDKVGRIIPEGSNYGHRFNPVEEAIKSEIDFFEDIKPNLDSTASSKILSNFIMENEQRIVDLFAYSVNPDWRSEWENRSHLGRRRFGGNGLIHRDKLAYELVQFLESLQFIKEYREPSSLSVWYSMPPQLLSAYMMILTGRIAYRHNLPPISDNPRHQAMMITGNYNSLLEYVLFGESEEDVYIRKDLEHYSHLGRYSIEINIPRDLSTRQFD